jgi:ankyrin repeat protein
VTARLRASRTEGDGPDADAPANDRIDWLDMVAMLLQKRVPAEDADAEGKTPLERAEAAGDMLLVQCFAE